MVTPSHRTPKNVHNPDLEQGRFGWTLLSGGALKTAPDDYIFGGITPLTAGTLSSFNSALAAARTVGTITGQNLPTFYHPLKATSMAGDGTLVALLWHEPA